MASDVFTRVGQAMARFLSGSPAKTPATPAVTITLNHPDPGSTARTTRTDAARISLRSAQRAMGAPCRVDRWGGAHPRHAEVPRRPKGRPRDDVREHGGGGWCCAAWGLGWSPEQGPTNHRMTFVYHAGLGGTVLPTTWIIDSPSPFDRGRVGRGMTMPAMTPLPTTSVFRTSRARRYRQP